MSNPLSVASLGRAVWHDFLCARRRLIICELLFKLVEAWILVPAVALVLAVIMSQAGHIAVSNQDMLSFLLTPLGLLYAALLAIVATALLLFEQAGIVVLAAMTNSSERPPVMQMLRAAASTKRFSGTFRQTLLRYGIEYPERVAREGFSWQTQRIPFPPGWLRHRSPRHD